MWHKKERRKKLFNFEPTKEKEQTCSVAMCTDVYNNETFV